MIRPLARRQTDDPAGEFERHAFDTGHAEKNRPPGSHILSAGLSMCGVDVIRITVPDPERSGELVTDFDPNHPNACMDCAVALGTMAAAEPGWRGGTIEA